jgi:hypothetical protein
MRFVRERARDTDHLSLAGDCVGAVADVVEVAWTVRLQRSEFDADQAARSTGTVSAILSLSVCQPSTLRIVI